MWPPVRRQRTRQAFWGLSMGGAVTVLQSPWGEGGVKPIRRRKVSVMVSSAKRLGSTRREPRSSCRRSMVPGAGSLLEPRHQRAPAGLPPDCLEATEVGPEGNSRPPRPFRARRGRTLGHLVQELLSQCCQTAPVPSAGVVTVRIGQAEFRLIQKEHRGLARNEKRRFEFL